MKTTNKPLTLLTTLIILLTIATSLGGLLLNGLYRDNAFLQLVWPANDLVTLAVAVPLLAGALLFARRGSQAALLVLLGMLDFTLYNFAYYLFSAAFNWFFLIYVALFVLSACALIAGLVNVDAEKLAAHFSPKTPARWIAGFMVVVALMLTTVYTLMTVNFITTGQVPAIITNTGHPTNVVFALDLSLVVPVFVVGGVWLWQRKPWGYLLATLSLVKGAVYNLVLTVVTLTVARGGFPEAGGELPLWVTLTATCTAGALFLLANFKGEKAY